MRYFVLFVCLLLTPVVINVAFAQEAVRSPLEIETSGQQYLDAVGRRIDSDVAYFDPSRPPPPFETTEQIDIPDPDAPESAPGQMDLPSAVISFLVLVAVLFVVWRFGPSVSVSLRPETANPQRVLRTASTRLKASHDMPTDLNALLNMANRQQALVILAHKVLLHAVRANGLLLQRSWTARDALRHLPDTQDDIETIKNLVLTSERVQFGNHEISAADLSFFVDQARPVLRGPSP